MNEEKENDPMKDLAEKLDMMIDMLKGFSPERKSVDEKEKENDEMKNQKPNEDECKKEDELQAKVDSLSDELAKVKSEKLDEDAIAKMVKDRRELERKAESVLSEESVSKIDSLSDLELKKLVISEVSTGDVDLKDKSDDYITARFDTALELSSNADKQSKSISRSFQNMDTDDLPDSEKARLDSMKKTIDGWKRPLGKTLGE